MTKPDKDGQKRRGRSPGRKLVDAKVRALAAEGKTTIQIAREVGLARQTVSGILNSEETKRVVKEAEGQIAGMIGSALETLQFAINTHGDLNNALKASLAVLKNYGLIKEKVDVSHSFPEPVVIHRKDGSTVILGTRADVTEGEDDEDRSDR